MKKQVVGLALVALAVSSLSASADVVALKRYAGLADGRGFDASLASAIADGSVTVYTGQNAVADTFVYSDQGWAQSQIYKNFGGSTVAGSNQALLVKFGLDMLPGFTGSTVAKAELRFYTQGGNAGLGDTGYITTSDWTEGSGTDTYPGAAGGVSGAHPTGYNDNSYQHADGTAVNVGWPPNMSIAPFSWADNQPFTPTKDGVATTNGMAHNSWGVTQGQWDQYVTVDVTEIMQLWANGTANYGLFVDGNKNYGLFLSENMTNSEWQPVLVMDYAPVPEPMTLTLLALGGLAVLRRRVNG